MNRTKIVNKLEEIANGLDESDPEQIALKSVLYCVCGSILLPGGIRELSDYTFVFCSKEIEKHEYQEWIRKG